MLAKGAAVICEVLLVAASAILTIVVFDPIVGLDLAVRALLEAYVWLVAVGIFYGLLALAVGAARPSRALAIGIAAGAAAGAYLVNGLHELAGWLDPFRILSPFWLVGSAPLQGGTDLVGVGVVLLAAVVILVVGAALVERRDLEVP